MNNPFPFKCIDLTHPLTASTPSWDNSCGFKHATQLDDADCTTDVQFKVHTISMHAGIGTHMDAPAHCYPNGRTIEQISLTDCIAPYMVVDISAKAKETYLCSKQDILEFEASYGQVQPGHFVIIRTGWDRFWTEPDKYRNNLQFPSISKEAAELLASRDIVGLGIDTLSPDLPESGYPVHQVLLESGKYIVENVANAHLVPPKNSYILALPLPIAGGTEAPVRLVALLQKERFISSRANEKVTIK